MVDVVWLIPALPLAGFLLILLFGRKLGDPKAGYLATAMIGAAFVVTVGVFADLMSMDAEERRHVSTLFRWVPVGDLQIDLAFLADPLSITMCLFVTGIGTLIHLYAVGYMHGDERFSKFFLYLNLFALSMLVLVLGENLLVTFLGWEGVGTCSYFLISFWHERESAATAGKKAGEGTRIVVTTTIGVDVRGTTEFRGEYDEGFFEKTVGLQLVDQGAHRRIESVTAGSDRGRIPKVIVHVPATEIDSEDIDRQIRAQDRRRCRLRR